MHRYILPEEKLSWFFKDTLFFALLGFLTFWVVYAAGDAKLLTLFPGLVLGSIFYVVVILFFYPLVRGAVLDLTLNNPLTKKLWRRRNVLSG